MERDGHLGISLLLYTPIAYVLTASDLTAMLGLGVASVVWWSLVPDVDQLLPIPHRGPTHSVVAAGLAGLLTALLVVLLSTIGPFGLRAEFVESALPWSPGATAAVFGFGTGVLGVLSHLLGDVVTPMGIRPWWPRSDRRYSLALVPSADIRTNLALAYVGTAVLIGTVALAAT